MKVSAGTLLTALLQKFGRLVLAAGSMIAGYGSLDWTIHEVGRTPDNRWMPLNQVAFGNGVFVAVADGGDVFRVDDSQNFEIVDTLPGPTATNRFSPKAKLRME